MVSLEQEARGRVLVISLTTIPPRFGGIVRVLETLLAQNADAVVLTLPKVWSRFPGHHAVPDVQPDVHVLRSDDLGPATKCLATRAAYPDADILICDDDCHYGPGWLDDLRTGQRKGHNQRRIMAASTFPVSRLKRRGHLVAQGYAGVLIPAAAPLPDHVPAAVRAADDLWVSAYWEAQGWTVTPCPTAREKVTCLDAVAPLQTEGRAQVYDHASAFIASYLKVWPTLD